MRSFFRRFWRRKASRKRSTFSTYSKVTGSPCRPQFTHLSEPGAVATGPILNLVYPQALGVIFELQSTLLS
jgi:hypothetical protein